MKTVLTIAGSDPSGGAGIQVDLLTFQTLGVHGMTAITATTCQNEKRFFSVNPVSSRLLREQLRAITDTHRIDAIKIGMLATEENTLAVFRFLEQMKEVKVVLDPVLKSTTGALLLEPKGIAILKQFVIPLSTIVTPNLDEAEELTKLKVRTIEQMREAALHLYVAYPGVKAVLVKGGHLKDEPTDVLYNGRDWILYSGKRYARGIHGTGCAFSAAVTAHLARGYSLEKSVERSKEYVADFIRLRV